MCYYNFGFYMWVVRSVIACRTAWIPERISHSSTGKFSHVIVIKITVNLFNNHQRRSKYSFDSRVTFRPMFQYVNWL